MTLLFTLSSNEEGAAKEFKFPRLGLLCISYSVLFEENTGEKKVMNWYHTLICFEDETYVKKNYDLLSLA